ncbi:MAG: hypothetical protein WC560_11735, partial [Syntrophales bacterium]
MKKVSIFLIANVIAINITFSQSGVSINAAGNPADPSAMLDISSTTQGVLIPRMVDADRNAIPAPAIGLLIYNTTTNKLNYYKSTGWYELSRTFQSSVNTGTNNPGAGVAINETGAAPDSSAILDVSSTTRGLLIPKTTSGSLTLVAGLIYYDNSLNNLSYYNGGSWKTVCETPITTITGTGSLTSAGVAINTTGNGADPSAMLDVQSDTRGLLIPRMTTTEREQILPVTGLMVYNTITNTIEYYNGTEWSKLETDVPAQPSAITGTASLCDGASGITYSITAVTGATTYTWSVPSGASITGGQGTTSVTVTFGSASGDVSVTANNACGPSSASTLAVTVNPNLPASVSIAANHAGAICAGTSVTFTATPTNGGSAPTYQWKNGGTNITGATSSTYTSTMLANNDVITCEMTSTESCVTGSPATSTAFTVTVNSNLPASVSIAAVPSGTICTGTSVTFTATPTNGGTPVYQWQLNGVNAGTNSATYTNAALATGNTVSCIMTSNLTCATGSPATSNTITITVTPNNTITLTSAVGTDAQTVCISTAITNITYTTTGATSANVTGLPAGVTGAWASNVVTISGTPTASGTFNYTVTLTGGCGTITATGSITVTPNNTITLTSAVGTNAQTKCISTAITSITYATTGATGATVTGLPAGVTGSWAANAVTMSGTPTASGTFNYTVTLTGGCGTVTATGTITVNPLPNVFAG